MSDYRMSKDSSSAEGEEKQQDTDEEDDKKYVSLYLCFFLPL